MIRLRTLGALDLRNSDRQEVRAVLAQPKRAALLVYLALASPRGPHRRDALLALFWPELDDAHARDALSQAIHFLRRSLGSELLTSRNGDQLELDRRRLWCDVVAFEEALDAGRLSDGLALYAGELLQGFHVANAPDFARWLEAERERLARRQMKALEELANEREGAGDSGGASSWWRRLAAKDPYSSRVALRLMRALAAAGDAGGAVQHARMHETVLREELEVPLDPEVARFVRQLQSSRPELTARLPSPAALPNLPEITAGDAPSSLSPRTSRLARVPEFWAAPADRKERAPARHRRSPVIAMALLAVCAAGASGAMLKSWTSTPQISPVRSLAVLPLEIFSHDSAQQWFADGVHDALITELARYPDLTVISRTSVLRYKATTKPLPEIARELRVDGVVYGSVLRDGRRVRVTAKLVHGPSDRHLWARSYERDVEDVLVLQGQLASAIAREVRVATGPAERSPRMAGRLDPVHQDLHLRELVLRGRHAELSRSLAGVQIAKDYYRRAIERDSTFASAYAGLAGAYGLMAMYGYAPARPAWDSARLMARRAVALDSTLPETRTALAIVLGDAREFEAAEREFKRAIQLAPSDARAHFQYSMLLVALGRGQDALRVADRAAQLDPFAPRGVLMMQRNARYLIDGKRPFMELPAGTRWSSIIKVPGEPWARRANAFDLAEAGRCPEARAEIIPAQQLAPGTVQLLVALAMIEWWCGDRTRARASLDRVGRHQRARDQATHIANAYSVFGQKDSAFAWLGRERWAVSKLTDLRATRWLDPLRSDPRYAELLQRLGLRPAVRTDTALPAVPDAARSRRLAPRTRGDSARVGTRSDLPS